MPQNRPIPDPNLLQRRQSRRGRRNHESCDKIKQESCKFKRGAIQISRSNKLVQALKKLRQTRWWLARAIYSIALNSWYVMKFFIDPRYRSEKLTRLRYGKEMIQTSSFTKMNRYPKLFAIAAKELEAIPNPKILSFGCSTGEEVFSIHDYIPNAEITGVDINKQSLSIARKNDKAQRFSFLHFRDPSWQNKAYYDCIFALAVFQRTQHRKPEKKETLKSFQFKHFSEMMTLLNATLKKGGYIILDNQDFNFWDLEFSSNYKVSKRDPELKRDRPFYSSENINTNISSVRNRVFQKMK